MEIASSGRSLCYSKFGILDNDLPIQYLHECHIGIEEQQYIVVEPYGIADGVALQQQDGRVGVMRCKMLADPLSGEAGRQCAGEVFDPPPNLRSIEFETGAVRQPEESPEVPVRRSTISASGNHSPTNRSTAAGSLLSPSGRLLSASHAANEPKSRTTHQKALYGPVAS